MTRLLEDWAKRANQLECDALAARLEADSKPSIAVADLVTWRQRIIGHDGKMYEVSVKELEIEKRASL